ncbi:hypothetical protein PSA7680_02669 [Pseudoruegeria aquimaris]|uniref:DUF4231 domain-containing protein n=1 Tax=Pseudoruegeria aquimaris TaxID=393663 RepID=A0A1Y5T187_9RHOB|nr:DUF4231 domain-containing protein [Pseudoruegeria aquimaris]SLN51447.1 hypothetical protein PSA7680_02669 [Pseudoruegeria aquimaris]
MNVGLEFPALYISADEASASAQRAFLWTIRVEYFLLFSVSALSSTRDMSGLNPLALTLLLVFLAGLFVLKVYRKLDQDWYRSRALAESVKTSTWRFVMRAHPFQDAASVEQPRAEFRDLLRDILRANQHLSRNLYHSDADQVTASMMDIRGLTLSERKDYYVRNRIDEQRHWYSRKSKENRRAFRAWVVVTIAVYIVAAISINAEQLGLGYAMLAFDPLIVVVTSIIGWIQIKRHSELTASYNLTAHEIGIIRSNADYVKSEDDFSDFVNEAELAFSREHTQWVARRDAS